MVVRYQDTKTAFQWYVHALDGRWRFPQVLRSLVKRNIYLLI